MRVLIATAHAPFVRGGAEAQVQALSGAMRAAGHEVDVLGIPAAGASPSHLYEQMISAAVLDVSRANDEPVDRLVAIKFPGYLLQHPERVLWLDHLHRQAYELWQTADGGLERYPDALPVRDALHEADQRALGSARRVFALSGTVAGRLAAIGIEAEPLYSPLVRDDYCRCASEPFVLVPSRLVPTKRQHLVIEALAAAPSDLRLVVTGAAEAGRYARGLVDRAGELGVVDRIEFRGHVGGTELVDLYSRCRAVAFVPYDEDYGYVTLEAMCSAKPVVTCQDSGGPLEFVTDAETGFVAEPDPVAVGEALARVWDRVTAERLGAAGHERFEALDLRWDRVVDRLLGP